MKRAPSPVLAIETSCDETAAAVVEGGVAVRSSVVASQAELHARYGGVFPEMASRQHIRDISEVVALALEGADVGLDAVEAVAVTRGPGLSGALLVGVNYAKGLALGAGKPVIGVNHLAGHLYSNWLHDDGWVRTGPVEAADLAGRLPSFPYLSLIVSGGHTDLVLVRGHGAWDILGSTLDDAAGEAFDKAARMLGLGYPGGPEVQRVAREGDPEAFELPVADLEDPLAFSFSGLKTALLREVERLGDEAPVADLAASFQSAVVAALVRGVLRALRAHPVNEVHLAGGVSANERLREAIRSEVDAPVRVPPVALCTDNAAMIGAAAYWHAGAVGDGLAIDVEPGLSLAEI